MQKSSWRYDVLCGKQADKTAAVQTFWRYWFQRWDFRGRRLMGGRRFLRATVTIHDASLHVGLHQRTRLWPDANYTKRLRHTLKASRAILGRKLTDKRSQQVAKNLIRVGRRLPHFTGNCPQCLANWRRSYWTLEFQPNSGFGLFSWPKLARARKDANQRESIGTGGKNYLTVTKSKS